MYEKIIQDKYINYFNGESFDKDDLLFNSFLNEMIDISEQIAESEGRVKTPKQILKETCNKNNLELNVESFPIVIENKLKDLSKLEIFAFLWYYSCRNVFLYEDIVYMNSAKKGIIGKLLTELKN